jgi:hypothetical protein
VVEETTLSKLSCSNTTLSPLTVSDSEKVETIIHYIASHMRYLWKTLDGYNTGDWETFKSTLKSLYPDTSAATRYNYTTLQEFVNISAKRRMRNEDDVMMMLSLDQDLLDLLCNPLLSQSSIKIEQR